MTKPYKCETCKDTGWYGDNGPGIKGNREYVPCECQAGKIKQTYIDPPYKGGTMNRFREIYDEELNRTCEFSPLEHLILDAEFIRGFVYEVCKRVLADENRVMRESMKKVRDDKRRS